MGLVADTPTVASGLQFSKASRQGFGERQNTWAWSMLWWRGKLYVGTNRAFLATERAALTRSLPWLKNMAFVKYPPDDPDVECPPDPSDLPLSAEIWRWSPEGDLWERVYVSPPEVPIPGHPGKFVAHDVGYREMTVFTEADGTEAMYVSGVGSRYIFGEVPAPRLLRSVDGLHFEAVPQAAESVLGAIKASTLRTIVSYKGRFFVTAGRINGNGVLYEAANPAGGNDNFRQVSPNGMQIFEMTVFNDHIYLGLRDPKGGYAVVKTDASGEAPYRFTTVVGQGAFLPQPSLSAISMCEFQGRLYVGTDRPAEIIRISPDDSWELVVGTPRKAPEGWKYPVSGLDDGFGNWLNGHIWRMQVHDGRLYIGTMNMATTLRNIPDASRVLDHNYGFNLYATGDGCHFVPVTLNGFGDKFDFGLRTMTSTPHGLFLGTANSWYGLHIWRGTQPNPSAQKPMLLEAEVLPDKVILSWDEVPNTNHYRIWRSTLADERRFVERNPFISGVLKVARKLLPLIRQAYLPPLPEKLWIPGPYAEVGTSKNGLYVDPLAHGERFHYYVEPIAADGTAGEPSNLVAVPSLAPVATFSALSAHVDALCMRRKQAGQNNLDALQVTLVDAWTDICSGQTTQARDHLQGLLLRDAYNQLRLSASDKADLQIALDRICRRLRLCELGYISVEALQ